MQAWGCTKVPKDRFCTTLGGLSYCAYMHRPTYTTVGTGRLVNCAGPNWFRLPSMNNFKQNGICLFLQKNRHMLKYVYSLKGDSQKQEGQGSAHLHAHWMGRSNATVTIVFDCFIPTASTTKEARCGVPVKNKSLPL